MEPLEPRDRGLRGPNDAQAGHPEDPGGQGAPVPNPGGLRDPNPVPDDEELRRRDELADRAGAGSPSPAGRDRPDLLPDVEPSELPM